MLSNVASVLWNWGEQTNRQIKHSGDTFSLTSKASLDDTSCSQTPRDCVLLVSVCRRQTGSCPRLRMLPWSSQQHLDTGSPRPSLGAGGDRIDKAQRSLTEQVRKGQTGRVHHVLVLFPHWQKDPLSPAAGPAYASGDIAERKHAAQWRINPSDTPDWMKMETTVLPGRTGVWGMAQKIHFVNLKVRELRNRTCSLGGTNLF